MNYELCNVSCETPKKSKCPQWPQPPVSWTVKEKSYIKSTFTSIVAKKEEEVEKTMTYNDIEATRKYLSKRIQSVYYDHLSDLNKKFRMDGYDTPRTYKQLIDAIKNDKYTLDKKVTASIDQYIEDEEEYYGSVFDGIKFKLDTAPDREGFKAATLSLTKAQQLANDIVNTQDATPGLKALQDFEAWVYSEPKSA